MKPSRFLTGAAVAALIIGAPTVFAPPSLSFVGTASAQQNHESNSEHMKTDAAPKGGHERGGHERAMTTQPSHAAPARHAGRAHRGDVTGSTNSPDASAPKAADAPGKSAEPKSGTRPGRDATGSVDHNDHAGPTADQNRANAPDRNDRNAAQIPNGRDDRSAAQMPNDANMGDQGKVSVTTFHQRLQSDGKWTQVATLGDVWRPEGIPQDWKPYSRGRWIFNEKVGWYFESDEPWAEITYHYGRWYDDPEIGWIWVPGTEWAPAWVEWRKSKQYIGWRPLPPKNAPKHASHGRGHGSKMVEETWVFVPADKIVSENVQTVELAPQRVTTVYEETTVVGHVERRGDVFVDFSIRPQVIERETDVRITSQPLPRVNVPVPAVVQQISSATRTTTESNTRSDTVTGTTPGNAATGTNTTGPERSATTDPNTQPSADRNNTAAPAQNRNAANAQHPESAAAPKTPSTAQGNDTNPSGRHNAANKETTGATPQSSENGTNGPDRNAAQKGNAENRNASDAEKNRKPEDHAGKHNAAKNGAENNAAKSASGNSDHGKSADKTGAVGHDKSSADKNGATERDKSSADRNGATAHHDRSSANADQSQGADRKTGGHDARAADRNADHGKSQATDHGNHGPGKSGHETTGSTKAGPDRSGAHPQGSESADKPDRQSGMRGHDAHEQSAAQGNRSEHGAAHGGPSGAESAHAGPNGAGAQHDATARRHEPAGSGATGSIGAPKGGSGPGHETSPKAEHGTEHGGGHANAGPGKAEKPHEGGNPH